MKRRIVILVCLPIILVGCGRSPAMYGTNGLAMQERLARGNTDRLFSYNHFLSLSMAREAIKPRYEQAQERCLRDVALQCTLVSASINTAGDAQSDNNGTFAQLVLALPHDKISEFENGVLAPDVTVLSRSTSAENVSREASDAARKLAQLADYRDRLTQLAKRTDLSVDDLIKIESELSKAQSDLDDATSRKSDVGERVSKERLSIDFGEEPGSAMRSVRWAGCGAEPCSSWATARPMRCNS